MASTERDVLRHGAYGSATKLQARQRLWSFVDPVLPTGRIYSVLDLDGSETIVDMGCGNGRDLVALRADGHVGAIIGVDFSAAMLDAVPPAAAHRVNADAIALPIAGGRADVVCAMHVLYHVPDIGSALTEAKRIMRSSGAFVCSTNSEDSMPELTVPWFEAMRSVGGTELARPSHGAFSVQSAEPLLRQVFEAVELHRTELVAHVPDAAVVRDYIASTADLYRTAMPDPTRWVDVLDHVEAMARRCIEQNGTFDISQRAGTFVCR